MSIYLVGGAVRDLLLGRRPGDLDFAFSGSPESFVAEHAEARVVGVSVRVCLWRGHEYMPLRENSLERDLAARDLTINALALEESGRLHCHPQALRDLRDGILRPASVRSFLDDPARVFRVARLAAALPGFRLAGECAERMRAVPDEALRRIPAERVGRELLKALATPLPGRFLQVLDEGSCLRVWFSELDAASTIPAGPRPWHDGSVLEHLADVMNAVAGDPLSAWMALCHDLGKVTTPGEELPHHYGHEKRGVLPAVELGRRLRLPRVYQQAGALAAEEHMRAGLLLSMRPGRQRDVLWRVHRAGLHNSFWRMVDADGGIPLSGEATRRVELLRNIHLPPEWRNRGRNSEMRLRELHCAALSALNVHVRRVLDP